MDLVVIKIFDLNFQFLFATLKQLINAAVSAHVVSFFEQASELKTVLDVLAQLRSNLVGFNDQWLNVSFNAHDKFLLLSEMLLLLFFLLESL